MLRMVTYDFLNYYTRHKDHWNSHLFYEKMSSVSKYDKKDARECGAMEFGMRMRRLELYDVEIREVHVQAVKMKHEIKGPSSR